MPELTVVIPTRDRAARLSACVASLGRQAGDVDFEVVVVDDGSTDHTAALVESLQLPMPLRLVRQTRAGAAAARNLGAEEAASEVLLFLDDDIVADARLVEAHLSSQRSHAGSVGLGRLVLDFDRRPSGFARHFARERAAHFDRLARGERMPEWRHCYGGNLSLQRERFRAVGGFASDLPRAHDIELGYRLAQAGLEFVFIPDAVGHEISRRRFVEIARHFDREGAAGVELYRRHPPTIEKLELGGPVSTSLRAYLVRRALLSLRLPLRTLLLLDPLMQGRALRQRWYRFLATYYYWRGVRRAVTDRDTWRRLNARTAILVYHALAADGERPSRYAVSARAFARQMQWLARRRFTVISLSDYLDHRRAHSLPPARAVVITFDDGYSDVLAHALPVLRRHGFAATVFVVTRSVGTVASWEMDPESARPLVGRRLLSWSELRDLGTDGVEPGGHTRTHPHLTRLEPTQAAEEIAGSREDIERGLDRRVRAFAYPYGDQDEDVQKLVIAAGYDGACTTRAGLNDARTPLSALRRLDVRGGDSLLQFAVAVRSGNPWLLDRLRKLRVLGGAP